MGENVVALPVAWALVDLWHRQRLGAYRMA